MNSCRTCQRRVLDAFASLAIPPLSSARVAPVQRQSIRQLKTPSRRLLHISRPFSQQQQPPPSQNESDLQSTSHHPEATTQPQSKPPTSSQHIPWYLQVAPPEPLTTPASLAPNIAAQALPPLPADPPAILQHLLHHLSITLGLDHLTIIDLRSLQPPSALGANLLMILGTARSEKHLNTSADRCCRWLRTTYKLRPFADGLLGRNEMKLKLRRRNKKLKLAQSVGNTLMGAKEYDDGITTGWICCNLGDVSLAKVADEQEIDKLDEQEMAGDHPVFSRKDQERIMEDEEDEYSNPSDDDFKYRGFGSASTAPRIVVQMFTEEKRLEMDLEGLWESRLNRRENKAQRLEQTTFDEARFAEQADRPAAKNPLVDARPSNESGARLASNNIL